MRNVFRTIIVDDIKSHRADIQSAVESFFKNKGHDKYECKFFLKEGVSVLNLAKENIERFNESDIAFIDYYLSNSIMNGLQVAEKLKECNNNLNIVFVSAQADFIDIKRQDKNNIIAYWVPKPIDYEIISNCLSSVIYKKEAAERESLLMTKVSFLVNHNFSNYQKIALENGIIYNSKAMEDIVKKVCKIAPLDTRVLITGENGTGKELIAKMIHKLSLRKNQLFIPVNCAAIPTELIESDLFGHEKGSFTNAFQKRIGKFEQANGGTLFLDEIGDMSLSAQAKVLRALQDNKITRLGGTMDISVNVRVLAATNKNLHSEIQKKRFREDLFYRLNVISLQLPTLNKRGNKDIRLLADYYIRKERNKNNISINIPETIFDLLCTFNYEGNIRQLVNIIEGSLALSDKVLTPDVVLDVYNNSRVVNNSQDNNLAVDMYESNENMILNDYYPHQVEKIKKDLMEYENKYNEIYKTFLQEYENDKSLKEPTIRDVSISLGHSYNFITERFTGLNETKEIRRDKVGYLLTNELKYFKIKDLAPFKKIVLEYLRKGPCKY